MDNITHSLIGAAFGEAFYQVAKTKGSAKENSRPVFYLVSILANNFPDLDLLYRFLDPSSLGYLLHHRGHTHTFIWLWPQLLLMLLIVGVYAKAKDHEFISKEKLWLIFTAAAGLHLHIGMDYLNSYGVHPLHPFNNEWFYGDRIFIIEPLMWSVLLPLLYLSAKSKWKHITKLPCSALIIFGVYAQALNFFSLVVIGFLTIFTFYLLNKSSELMRPFKSIVLLLLVISTFGVFGSLALDKIINDTENNRLTKLIDLIISPTPANPFCWTVLLIDGDTKNYRIHRGVVNILPALSDCPDLSRGIPNELMRAPSEFKDTAHIDWMGFYKTTYSKLLNEINKNCELKAWFQFARAPLKEGTFYTDVRFPGPRRGGFASLNTQVEDGQSCPPYSAPWRPPLNYEKLLKRAP